MRPQGAHGRVDARVAAWVSGKHAASFYISALPLMESKIGILRIERRDTEGMKKSDSVERVAGEAVMTKQVAEAAVGTVFASIAAALARGKDVTVTGFGRFSRRTRLAREGRDPRTGERIAVGPSATVSFKGSEALKDALN